MLNNVIQSPESKPKSINLINQLLVFIIIRANTTCILITLYIIWSSQNALKLPSPLPPPCSLVICSGNLVLLDTKRKRMTSLVLRLFFDLLTSYFRYLVVNTKKNIPITNERENWLLVTDEPVENEKQSADIQDFWITWLHCLTIDTWGKKFGMTFTQKNSKLYSTLIFSILWRISMCHTEFKVMLSAIKKPCHP